MVSLTNANMLGADTACLRLVTGSPQNSFRELSSKSSKSLKHGPKSSKSKYSDLISKYSRHFGFQRLMFTQHSWLLIQATTMSRIMI